MATHYVWNNKTRCVVLRGTQAQCLSASGQWMRNAQHHEFTVYARDAGPAAS